VRSGAGRSFTAAACLVFAACVIVLAAPHALAQAPDDREALIATLDGASLEELLATPAFLSLAQQGGASLMVTTIPWDEQRDALYSSRGLELLHVRPLDLGHMAVGDRVSEDLLAAAADTLAAALDGSSASHELVLLESGSADAIAQAAGDGLGAVVMASGSPEALASALRAIPKAIPVDTLTSDSTRRRGVVIDADVITTAVDFAAPTSKIDPGGETIRIVHGPPPLDLHDRYVQSKRLTVPIGTAAAVYVGLASLIAIIALWRPDISSRHRPFCASLAISASPA